MERTIIKDLFRDLCSFDRKTWDNEKTSIQN